MARYNKRFAKVNEERNLEFAPLPLLINGNNVWTNIPEIYIENGYYPIEKTKTPEKEGFYYISYWEFENNKCVQKWEEHEVSIVVSDSATDEEIQAAIQEGVNSIDY